MTMNRIILTPRILEKQIHFSSKNRICKYFLLSIYFFLNVSMNAQNPHDISEEEIVKKYLTDCAKKKSTIDFF